jgi:hypothetical protein
VNRKNGLEKMILTLGLVGSHVLAGMDADVPKNFETLDTRHSNNQISFESNPKVTDDTANPFRLNLDNNLLFENPRLNKSREKESSYAESKENTVQKFNIDLTTFFELGNAVISLEKQQELKLELINFFDPLSQVIKDKIKSGEIVIMIESGSSPEPIKKTGIKSGRGIIYNNVELSRHRAEAAEDIIKSSLTTADLDGANIKITIPENGINPDNPVRYVNVSIQAGIGSEQSDILENIPVPIGLEDSSILENIPQGILKKLYIDGSASMRGKASKLFKTLERGGYVDGLVELQLGSGLDEISRIVKIKTSEDVSVMDWNIRHQKEFSATEETFANAKRLFENMPRVNDEDRDKETVKIITLLTDEYLKITAREISSLEFQEVSHGAKLVFFMENRDSGKVTSFTLEKIKKLYEAKAKKGEMLTFDVNSKKIENNENIDIFVD